jgi:isoleucyl-tRNA synthetase
MSLAQRVSSLVLSLRKKEQIKVRQPLQRIMIPVLDDTMSSRIRAVDDLIRSEVNVKEIELLSSDNDRIVKSAKANFKVLGKRFGKQMKAVAAVVAGMDASHISTLERDGKVALIVDGESHELGREEIELTSQDIPGWLVATDREVTVALDISLDNTLLQEGVARELVNRIQNYRKDQDFDVTDLISVQVERNEKTDEAIMSNKDYICAEILAGTLEIVDSLSVGEPLALNLIDDTETRISIVRSV